MTREEKIKIVEVLLLRWFGIIGAIVLTGLFFFSYKSFLIEKETQEKVVQGERIQEQIKIEKLRERSEIVNYLNVSPYKKYFGLGETIKSDSHREIYDFNRDADRKFVSLGGLDILYCDTYDGEGMGRTKHEAERVTYTAEYGQKETKGRERKSGTPENPTGVYIPATCKFLVKVELCYEFLEENICRKQILWSEEFFIRDEHAQN